MNLKNNLIRNLVLLPIFFFHPKLSAEKTELDLRNFYHSQGWIHATCYFYQENLLGAIPASEIIDIQMNRVINNYPNYFLSNSLKVLEDKFPSCAKELFLKEQFLNN